MNEDRPLFILAGNGPYENRGCEAIVRGTTKILREYFNDPQIICLSHFLSEGQYQEQRLQETDRAIVHLASCMLNKKGLIRNIWKPETWFKAFQYCFNRDTFHYQDILPHLGDASAVLSIGGDNYSLDYGEPTLFTALDDLVLEHGRPIFLWGASIGPFSAIPEYEQYMSNHLHKVTGIFARESATVEYLDGIGVTENVYTVADPAFQMDPMKPEEEISIMEGAIGINLSPLMAKYVTGGDLEQWTKTAAMIVAEVVKITERPIYLIPHVTTFDSNDHTFMQRVLSQIPEKNKNITLVPPRYNAAETKWIISQMAFFVGARTHSTIAALSSCIPTMSFAYSIKARGINRDLFGHMDYCITLKDLDAKTVSHRITLMLDRETRIRRDLTERIPVVQRSALHAGNELKRLI